MRGRKLQTGRYETREELEAAIREDYHGTSFTVKQVALLNRCSIPTVHAVLNGKTAIQKERLAKLLEARDALPSL
jgi:hypothetical protein